jgi:hypothetical protein
MQVKDARSLGSEAQEALQSLKSPEVTLLGQRFRLEPAHLAGTGGISLRALPATHYSHGGVLSKALGIIGVVVAGQAAVDRLSEQRSQVVLDIPAGATFLEVVLSDFGKAEDFIQFSNG